MSHSGSDSVGCTRVWRWFWCPCLTGNFQLNSSRFLPGPHQRRHSVLTCLAVLPVWTQRQGRA